LEDFTQEARELRVWGYLELYFQGEKQSQLKKKHKPQNCLIFMGFRITHIYSIQKSILMHRFKKELLRRRRKAIGTLDGELSSKETDLCSRKARTLVSQ